MKKDIIFKPVGNVININALSGRNGYGINNYNKKSIYWRI